LLLEQGSEIETLLSDLRQSSVLLPTVLLVLDPQTESYEINHNLGKSKLFSLYHSAIAFLDIEHIGQLEQLIQQAIENFLHLSSTSGSSRHNVMSDSSDSYADQSSLMTQQRRLAEKLKERLGYLGVYYKRSPQNFLRYMSPEERKDFLRQLKNDYRDIILCYFSKEETTLNEKLDNFVNMAFFADVSVSQLVEIHMTLMYDFAKQLKLEGRNEEILQDYRLTLIDTLAHLCEMYRRSIPRET
jgi:circadian clock protein KaiA